MAWNIPPLMVSSGTLNEPRSALGANAPCTTTVKIMTTMLMSASVLALANYSGKKPLAPATKIPSQATVTPHTTSPTTTSLSQDETEEMYKQKREESVTKRNSKIDGFSMNETVKATNLCNVPV